MPCGRQKQRIILRQRLRPLAQPQRVYPQQVCHAGQPNPHSRRQPVRASTHAAARAGFESDHSLLVTAGQVHQLIVIGTQTEKILQRVPLPSDQAQEMAPALMATLDPDGRGQLSFTGLTFSPDGSRIYLSNLNGDIKVFDVAEDKFVSPLFSIALPPANAPGRKEEIPAGVAVSPDGKKIYVALNLSNRLAELDAATGKVLRIWDVGVAPYDVVAAGKKFTSATGAGGGRTRTVSPGRRGAACWCVLIRFVSSPVKARFR